MTIYVSQTAQGGRFINPSRVASRVQDLEGNERLSFVLSGIVDLQSDRIDGSKESNEKWNREKIALTLDLGEGVPRDKDFIPAASAPLVTLSSIANKGHAINLGFAVDRVAVEGAGRGVTLLIDVAVRDTDAVLHRIGYHVTVVGHLADRPSIE